MTYKTYLDESKSRFDPSKKPDTLLGALDLRGFTLESTCKKPTPEDIKALNNTEFLKSQTDFNKSIKLFQNTLNIPLVIEQEEMIANETSKQKKQNLKKHWEKLYKQAHVQASLYNYEKVHYLA